MVTLFFISGGRTKKITRRIKSHERQNIKNLGVSDNVIFHSSKKGKTTLIIKYPEEHSYGLMLMLMICLIDFKIHRSFLSMNPHKCLKALIHVGCIPLLEIYVKELLTTSLSVKKLCTLFSIIVEFFGFHFNHTIVNSFLEKFDEQGIPFDFLESFLRYEQKIDTSRLIDKIETLNNEWDNFWKYKTVKHCIICKLDLLTLLPITRRLETVKEMPCCKLVICSSCFLKIFEIRNTQCPACNTIMENDISSSDTAAIDIDLDNLHYVTNRNFYYCVQNRPLTREAHLPWPQPGSVAYGELVQSQRHEILQNSRMIHLQDGHSGIRMIHLQDEHSNYH